MNTLSRRVKREVLGLGKRRQLFLWLFVFSFTVSVTVTVIPCVIINTFGLFGEVKSSTIAQDNDSLEVLEDQDYTEYHKHKGINIINIWYELWCYIVCMIFIVYMFRLPRGNTIVTLKVRMDD